MNILQFQKSARWCIIDFENQEKLKEALEVLKKVKIENKSIKIFPYKKGESKRNKPEVGQSSKNLVKLLKKTA